VDSFEFCQFVLDRAAKWLNLDMLPALDLPAFKDPSRLLCNGCNWRSTGHGAIPQADLQAFYVSCGKDFRFKPASTVADVPLDLVEKALREKFTSFDWPGEFALNTQGPSFWIEGSVSAQSAVVHPGGMFTFSAHASKPFYPWGDILGREFIDQFTTKSISAATEDIWYDGLRFWAPGADGYYVSNKREDIVNRFKVNCRLSPKPGKDGSSSPVDQALNYLASGKGRIAGAAPFVFRKQGIIIRDNQRVLNIYNGKVLPMAEELTPWGPKGKFPFISLLLEYQFKSAVARANFLAWFQLFYGSGLRLNPHPGQNVYMLGPVAGGKTLTGQLIVGASVGGFCDASRYLIGGEAFNSQLLEKPLWTSDDETAPDAVTQAAFAANCKKSSANQQHLYSKKYEVPLMVNWEGRIWATMNLDFVSNRTLGSLDNSSLDKTNLFFCGAEDETFNFPDRDTVKLLIARELPYFLRWLMSYEVPDCVIRDARYGYKAYHDERLLDRAAQSGKFAPFKELLIEVLRRYFVENPESKYWSGSETQLLREIHASPGNSEITRSLRLEQTSRYLEMILTEGLLKCAISTGNFKTKIWTFERFETSTPTPLVLPTPSDSVGETIFKKS
jgi:hypothetical protein